jgi:N-acetyl-gamma-glutamyl-phosphate reductase
VRRGLLATCNVRSTGADLRELLEERYAESALVSVLPEGVAPDLARVQHTDTAELGVFADRHTDRTIVICALDNLGKGAAGQAVQNVNLLFGLRETAGLRHASVLV